MNPPSDYYFQFCPGDDPNAEVGLSEFPYFMITLRAYYDAEQALDDQCGGHNTPMPPDFYELAEATFEYDGDPLVGRQLLINAGFVEKKMF